MKRWTDPEYGPGPNRVRVDLSPTVEPWMQGCTVTPLGEITAASPASVTGAITDDMIQSAAAFLCPNPMLFVGEVTDWADELGVAEARQAYLDQARAVLAAAFASSQKPEPVAWRVKDFADGWILCHSEAQAKREAESGGNLVQPLYAAPTTERAEVVAWRPIADAHDCSVYIVSRPDDQFCYEPTTAFKDAGGTWRVFRSEGGMEPLPFEPTHFLPTPPRPGQIAPPKPPEAPAVAEGWRPIESAPRDGSAILITRPTDFPSEEAYHVVRWDGSPGEGWWQVHDGKFDHPLRGPDPTFWKPLAAAPARQGKE